MYLNPRSIEKAKKEFIVNSVQKALRSEGHPLDQQDEQKERNPFYDLKSLLRKYYKHRIFKILDLDDKSQMNDFILRVQNMGIKHVAIVGSGDPPLETRGGCHIYLVNNQLTIDDHKNLQVLDILNYSMTQVSGSTQAGFKVRFLFVQ